MSVLRVFPGNLCGYFLGVQGCFYVVLEVCYESVLRVFQGCFNVFQGGFNGILSVFQSLTRLF